jgi:hypothetical protein
MRWFAVGFDDGEQRKVIRSWFVGNKGTVSGTRIAFVARRWQVAVSNLYSIATIQAAINALFGARDIILSLLTARMAKPSQNGLVCRQKATFFT